MATLVFEKREGKYDAMFVEHDGGVQEVACPKQPPIPHDMFHYAVEQVLTLRGFLHRTVEGDRAGFRMAPETMSETVERLVETMQADSWSGRPPPAEVIDLFRTTCTARGSETIDIGDDAIIAIRAEVDRLAAQWAAVPMRGRMSLNI